MSDESPSLDDPRSAPLHEQAVRVNLMKRLFSVRQAPPHVGRFVVLERIGEGAMGMVWVAYDPDLDRKVAIKLLHGHLDGTAQDRVRSEARAMATVNHPNVAHVYEVGEHEGQTYLAMEYVRGDTLREWQSHAGRTATEILEAYLQVADGLAAAHEQGLVHRDFKPDNVVVEPLANGVRARVLDFGLARAWSEAVTDQGVGGSRSSAETARGGAGTPAYMAPEQFSGGLVGPAADQFAYCVALYEALWGQRPYVGDSVSSLRASIERGSIAVPSTSPRMGWVRRVLLKGLAPDPDDRHASMSTMVSLLRQEQTRRRRRWVAGVAVIAGLGAAAALGRAGADVPACEGTSAELVGVWDDARREEIRDAVLAVRRPIADQVWDRLEDELDAYTGIWTSAHEDACEATMVRREQSEAMMDRRMACLAHAKIELQAVTDLLTEANGDLIVWADELVASLPPLDRCSDVDALIAQRVDPSSAEASSVSEVRAALARARARRIAGDAEHALIEVGPAEEIAEHLRFDIHADIALEKGQCLEDAGEIEAAAEVLEQAQRLAANRDDDDVMFEATLARMWLVGYRQERHAEALVLRPVAEGLATSPRRKALVHNHVGQVLALRAEYDAAEAELRASVEQWLLVGGSARVPLAKTRSNLAQCLARLGRTAEAIEQQEAAVDVLGADLGSAHPDVAAARVVLGELLREAGDLPAALRQQQQALDNLIESRGAGHPDVAESRGALANTLYMMGRYAEAEAEHRRALEMSIERLGPENPGLAGLHNNLAAALFAQGKVEQAKAELLAAIAIKEVAFGPNHPAVASSRDNLGGVLRLEGDFAGAEAEHRRALEIRIAALGPDHPEVAQSFNNIAAVQQFSGDYEAAAEQYEIALTKSIAARGESHLDTAKYRVNLANVLTEIGQHARARELYQAALSSRRSALEPGHPEIAEAELGLGQSLMLDGERVAALPLLESAHAVFEAADVPPEAKAEAKFALARALMAEPGQRQRSEQLARAALQEYERDEPKVEIRAWLARTSVPAQRRQRGER